MHATCATHLILVALSTLMQWIKNQIVKVLIVQLSLPFNHFRYLGSKYSHYIDAEHPCSAYSIIVVKCQLFHTLIVCFVDRASRNMRVMKPT
jgi:hypothetical protein